MNQQQYLEEIAQTLRSLPAPKREQELAEIRAHLDASVNAARLRGCTRQQAEAEAVRQFDVGHQVGNGLKRAWWRERTGAPYSLWKTAALALGLRYAAVSLLSPLGKAVSFATYSQANVSPSHALDAGAKTVLVLVYLLPTLVVGVSLAKLSPRNAVAGVALSLVLSSLVAVLNTGVLLAFQPDFRTSQYFSATLLNDPLQALMMLAATWLTVRYTRKHFACAL